jgi:hypothetical protein
MHLICLFVFAEFYTRLFYLVYIFFGSENHPSSILTELKCGLKFDWNVWVVKARNCSAALLKQINIKLSGIYPFVKS